jgi:hypothetical protein
MQYSWAEGPLRYGAQLTATAAAAAGGPLPHGFVAHRLQLAAAMLLVTALAAALLFKAPREALLRGWQQLLPHPQHPPKPELRVHLSPDSVKHEQLLARKQAAAWPPATPPLPPSSPLWAAQQDPGSGRGGGRAGRSKQLSYYSFKTSQLWGDLL